jgi:hypothetical protein
MPASSRGLGSRIGRTCITPASVQIERQCDLNVWVLLLVAMGPDFRRDEHVVAVVEELPPDRFGVCDGWNFAVLSPSR